MQNILMNINSRTINFNVVFEFLRQFASVQYAYIFFFKTVNIASFKIVHNACSILNDVQFSLKGIGMGCVLSNTLEIDEL